MNNLLHTMFFIYPLIKSFFKKDENNGPRLQEYIVGCQPSEYWIPINNTKFYKGNKMNNRYYITEEEYKEVVIKRKEKYKYVISELSNVVDIFNIDGIHFNIKVFENDFILYTLNQESILNNEIIKEKRTYLMIGRDVFILNEQYEINEYTNSGGDLTEVFESIYNDLKLKKEIKEELDKVDNNNSIKKKVKL